LRRHYDAQTTNGAPTGYISNEITPPVTYARTKRKYTDMITSNLRFSDGGTFLPFDQSAGAVERQDATENEDEDDENHNEENGGENDEENDQPPSSRRRFV
jgi:hypothetical protein